MIRPFVLGLFAALLVGCTKEPMAADQPQKDPYAGMSPQAKIDAIRKDPSLMGPEKATKISDAQKAAGLPVTGQ